MNTHLPFNDAQQPHVLAEQLRMSYRQLPTALIVGVVLALASCWLFYEQVPGWILLTWLSAHLLATLTRYFGLRHIGRDVFHPSQAQQYAQRYFITAFLLGCVWAALALLVPYVGMEDRIIIFVLLVSITSGTLTTNAGHVASSYAYIAPVVITYSVGAFLLNEKTWALLGVLMIIYAVYLALAGWKLHASLHESIRLRYRWQATADDLEDTKGTLSRELKSRSKTEKHLKTVMTELELAVEHLKQLAAIDELTGLANRRSFDAAIVREWNRARREQTAISLLMVDIDHFKSYNDFYHHQKGDDTLRAVAQVLKSFARRPGDIATRYGGEEFALILVNSDKAHVKQIADQLCQQVRELQIQHEGAGSEGLITVSIGTAIINGPKSDDYSDLISRADRALYQAKDAGRDQVKAA